MKIEIDGEKTLQGNLTLIVDPPVTADLAKVFESLMRSHPFYAETGVKAVEGNLVISGLPLHEHAGRDIGRYLDQAQRDLEVGRELAKEKEASRRTAQVSEVEKFGKTIGLPVKWATSPLEKILRRKG